MDKNALSQLVQELGELIGLPHLELDENQACYVSFDDLLVCLEVDASLEKVMLYAPVADLPETDREHMLLTVLKGNLFWGETGGGTLAVSAATHKVILQELLSLESLTPAILAERLEVFLNHCESWFNRLSTEVPAAGASRALEVHQFV